ncbi:MAG: ferritin-like domain-containing protein [Micrococcales bacterium]|nr:ferritin-like domain-containing protein [Micrococcales bacterium]
MDSPREDALADPEYRQAVVDLLGALAYAELSAFTQLVADSEEAPNHGLKARVCRLAVAEFGQYEDLVAGIRDLGADPDEAMAPFTRSIDDFHARTSATTWLEGLVKAYVGEGIAGDFYREVAAYVDPSTRALVHRAVDDDAQSDLVLEVVGNAIEADPRVAGRLALWGRRLVGEALSQAQHVAVERDGLASLLVGGVHGAGADLAELGRMFTRLTDAHTERMTRLGLSA